MSNTKLMRTFAAVYTKNKKTYIVVRFSAGIGENQFEGDDRIILIIIYMFNLILV